MILALATTLALAVPKVADEPTELPTHPTSEAAHHAEPGVQGHSVPEVIFHHVTDGKTWEIENPFSGGAWLVVDFDQAPYRRQPHDLAVIDLDLDWTFQIAGKTLDLSPTKHSLMMWVVTLVLALFLWAAVRRRALVPRGLYAFVEMVVQWIYEDIAQKNIPDEKEARRFTPYLLTAFFFIFFNNLWGLLPFMATATGNLGITAGLALCTFFLTQVAGIRAAGLGGYLKHLTGGVHPLLWPIMIPVEILGLFTKPFALCVRLFANMVAGHIVVFFLIGLIFLLSVWLAPVSVAFALAIFLLELFVAFIQAYVFTMLSSLFIGMAVATGHHAH